MKRNKPKEYAKAFLSAVRDKGVLEQKNLARALVETAVRRGEQKLLPRIQKEIVFSIEKEEKNATAHILFAHTAHAKREREKVTHALSLLGAENAPEYISEDQSIIGGFQIRYGEKLYDASHRKHLLDLYRRLTA